MAVTTLGPEGLLWSFIREKAYPAFNVKSIREIPGMTRRLVGSILDSLGEDELEELLDSLRQDQYAPYYLVEEVQWYLTRSPKEKVVQRNEPITRLLAWYTDKKSKKVSTSSAELKRRFSGQSFAVQKTILKTFLQGGRKEKEWAGRYLLGNWIPSFRDLIIDKWKETRTPLFANIILRHFPDKVVFQNREDLAEDAGYAYVCARLGNMDGFTVDESRLSPSEWFYVMARLGRENAITRMDGKLKECILALSPMDLFPLGEGSLLSAGPLSRVVWALKKLHCTESILRLSAMWDQALAFASREQEDYDKCSAMVFSLKQQVQSLPEDGKAYEEAKVADEQISDDPVVIPIILTNDDVDCPF